MRAIDAFGEDDCVTFAAAIAYYAVFSLPPLLFLIAILAGGIIGWEAIENQIFETIQSTIGPAVAEQLREALASYGPGLRPDSLMIVVSGAVLLFAATGVLVQLQTALNRAWGVQLDPQRGYVHNLIVRRLISLGMIVVLTAVTLASVLLGTIVAIAGERTSQYLPPGFSEPVLLALDLGAGFLLFFVAVAAVFGIMPDAKVELRDVWIGSAVTAALLSVGKFGVSLYLGSRNVAETFGPAAALAVLLLWIYYSSMILLFGAELTHAWASRAGRQILPADGAVAVIKTQVIEREPTPAQNERA